MAVCVCVQYKATYHKKRELLLLRRPECVYGALTFSSYQKDLAALFTAHSKLLVINACDADDEALLCPNG